MSHGRAFHLRSTQLPRCQTAGCEIAGNAAASFYAAAFPMVSKTGHTPVGELITRTPREADERH